jgi:FkbM family methyltransferase
MQSDDKKIHAILASLAEYFRDPADPVLFDVGAHEGSTIDLLLEMFPQSAIHAFEPDPGHFAKLSERCAAASRVTPHQVGVGSTSGRLEFHSNLFGSNGGVGSFLALDPRSGAQTVASHVVDVVTIDAFCRDNAIDHIDFLKLDVQGFEREVLLGAQRMLGERSIRTLQVEIIFFPFYERQLSFYDIESLLIPGGYRLFTVDNFFTTPDRQLFQLDAFYVGADFGRRA